VGDFICYLVKELVFVFCQNSLWFIIHENVQCAACFDHRSSLGTVYNILQLTDSADQCKLTYLVFCTVHQSSQLVQFSTCYCC
jgi:hypothetical protein